TDDHSSRKPLRLWPGIAAAVLLVASWVGLPIVWPDDAIYGMFGTMIAAVVIFAWWLFFSRAPWLERVGALALMVGGVFITWQLVDRSISNALMGKMLPFLSIPVQALALVIAVAASRGWSAGRRRAALAVGVVLGCSVFAVIRTGGITGDAKMDLHWR